MSRPPDGGRLRWRESFFFYEEMKIIWCLMVFSFVWASSNMPANGEELKKIAFRSVPKPDLWIIGENPAFLVVTGKNTSSYYRNPPPAADFANNLYLVAALGLKPSPGYTIKIEQLQKEKDKITIKIKIGEPQAKKGYAQVLVHPISIAEVPLVNLRPSTDCTFVFKDQYGKQLSSLKEAF